MTSLTPYTDSLKEKAASGTLILSVKEPWFSLMDLPNYNPNKKNIEVRDPTQWIKSRLFDKNGNVRNYKFIKIINGYGAHRPYFIAEYNGFGTGYDMHTVWNDNGKNINLKVSPEQYVIFLGGIIERGNCKNPK